MTLTGLLHRLRASNSLAILLITMSVQGLPIGAQFLVAFYLPLEDLGVIRALEATLAVVLLAASFGLPTITFREAAAHAPPRRGAVLRRVLSLGALAGGCTLLVGMVVRGLWPHLPDIWSLLCVMSGLVVFANSSRICVAFVQGGGLAARHAAAIVTTAVCAVILICLAVQARGVSGWVLGRYAGETLFAGVLIYRLRTEWGGAIQSGAPIPSSRGLIGEGLWANGALLIRSLCDNLPMILLGALGASRLSLGQFGLASLFLFAPQLWLAVLGQHHTPEIVRLHESSQDTHQVTRSLAAHMFRRGAAAGVGLLLIGGGLWFSGFGEHRAMLPILAVLAFTVPFRSITLAYGCRFMACRAYRLSATINVSEALFVLIGGIVIAGGLPMRMAFVVLMGSLLSVFLSLFLSARLGRAPLIER